MAWFDDAIFYHIYPLGLTGAPAQNSYTAPVSRLNTLLPWLDHIRKLGCNALYIGPLFESVGHGYETTDYKKLDSRLGTNDDLKNFVNQCHKRGIRVVLDGVFNHVGRDFFAFRDLKANREHSPYLSWFCNVNFRGNNHYGDGFRYDNWGGHDLLVKLNQKNPAVREYLLDVVRFWVSEFDIDGIRLDAADVLDFGFMQCLRTLADTIKPDFWLMGEVIHGNYSMWVNNRTLHSVTDYQLHQALFSGHNSRNYFEIAHTVNRIYDQGLKLYSFVDNHDVERIMSKLKNKAHYLPVHILLYTLPGNPSVYYGSEFGIEGRKGGGTDAPLRPCFSLDSFQDNECVRLIQALGQIRQKTSLLSRGDYRELTLTNTEYAFRRSSNGYDVITAVTNRQFPVFFRVPALRNAYVGALSGEKISAVNGYLSFTVSGNSGEIWIPEDMDEKAVIPVITQKKTPTVPIIPQKTPTAPAVSQKAPAVPIVPKKAPVATSPSKPYEHMTVPELQQAILEKLAKNGPVTDQMRRDVAENIWRDSLLTWVRSFR